MVFEILLPTAAASGRLLSRKLVAGTKLMRYWVHIAVFITGCIFNGTAWAASVFVKALEYDNADVIINGSEARRMWVGETSPEGVVLRSVADGAGLFETEGKLWTLKAGQGTYSQATLRSDPHGQFLLMAQVNGTPLPALIDTGATSVAMNSEDAYHLGIDYMRGKRVVARTASGPSVAYLVTFSSVQVGDIVLTNVPGSVIEVGKKELPLVLIGMSFLRNVDMRRSGNTMLLQRRDY
jgi:aspartyl protease family protein